MTLRGEARLPQVVQFRSQTWTPVLFHYPFGERLGLVLQGPAYQFDPSDALVASVNLPEYKQPEGYVFIKDWSENKGVLAALQAAGVVSQVEDWLPTGYVQAAVCHVGPEPEVPKVEQPEAEFHEPWTAEDLDRDIEARNSYDPRV